MQKQTLKQAIMLGRSDKSRDLSLALGALIDVPEGDCGRVAQARLQILNLLPCRDFRDYTVSEFIKVAYTVDHAGRYRSRLIT